MLSDLVKKGEIPHKLQDVAGNLRKLRNVGAHAVVGELTAQEIPIVDDLANALLQYVYGAPYLVVKAEERLKKLKASKSLQTP